MSLITILWVVLVWMPSALALEAGLLPVPVFTTAKVAAEAVLDSVTGRYIYRYTITNPAANTGEINYFNIDISRPPGGITLDSDGLMIPLGFITKTFDEEMADFEGDNVPMVPVGIQPSSGWRGSLGANGFAAFSSGASTPNILPGETLGEFQLISPGLPKIREIEIIPSWVFLVEDHDAVTPEEEQHAREIEDSLPFRSQTLGPMAVFPGSFDHWNHLRDDLNQAVSLGWIPDITLANSLVTQLASAREALDARDGTLAKTRLQPLLDTLALSDLSQRRQEAHDLVLLNVQSLIENTEDTPVPFEPQGSLIPQDQQLALGERYTVTAALVNLGDNNKAVEGFFVTLKVEEGPHAGERIDGLTDLEGKIRLSYIGRGIGEDKIRLVQEAEVITDFGETTVTWTGGPDLVVPFFIPPVIQGEAGRSLFLSDRTANLGNVPSAPSITRYYFSETESVDPATALVLGERAVPALQPGREHGPAAPLEFTLPGDLSPGHYFLAACADAPTVVVELNEENNCSFNDVPGKTIVVPMERSPNTPPDCSGAASSTARLWPPNHKLVTIDIQGVLDPEDDPINIRIASITQDEPVNGVGDGNTAPDGFGIGASSAQVRAERSGKGNGRVYVIGFHAEDGRRGACIGQVTVGVPHDQGKGSVPVDDGQIFDSTQS
ncbi:MAG: hypothetical protein ACE5GK_08465 [Nitrospiria bacterium]